MKTTRTNKILSLLLSMLMLLSVVPMTALAADEPAVRTFYVEADKTDVYAGDIVTVTVRVDGEELYGAEWKLTYENDKFELVEKTNKEYYYCTGNSPIASDYVLNTYTFKAIAQTNEVTGNFTVTNAYAYTRLEAAVAKQVEPVISPVDVKIKLKTDLTATVKVDDKNVGEENEKTVTYTDAGHTMDITSSVDGADIVVKINNNVIKDIADYEFTDVGEYVIEYTVTEKGYVTVEGTFTLNIVENAIAVTATLDEKTVEDKGSSKVTYDGSKHTFAVASNPEADIVIIVNGVGQGEATSYAMTAVGEYKIEWTVTRTGYTTVTGSYTFEIEAADITVTTKLDDVVVRNGEEKEIVYDDELHTFDVTSDPNATVSIKIGDDEYTEGTGVQLKDVGTYVISYKVEEEGHNKVEGTFTLTIKEATLKVDVSVDSEAVTAGTAAEKSFEYDGETHTVKITSDPAAAITLTVGEDTFTGTDSCEYTIDDVGEYVVNYTVAKEGYTTVKGQITIKYTDPEYVVEVAVNGDDYVSGKKIVLVYTNNDKVSFNYGEFTMFDVTSKGYTYDKTIGSGEFTHTENTKVYAMVVNAVTSHTFADYKDKVTMVYSPLTDGAYIITETTEELKCDVNNLNGIEIGDPIAAYASYHGESSYYSPLIAAVLRADVDADKDVDGTDTNACADAFEATK